TGVVQGVADDRVLFAEEHLKESAVGIEAGTVEDRILGAQERAERLLELCVEILRAADEPDGGHAVAMLLQSGGSSLSDIGIVGKSPVVIGAEIEDLALRYTNLAPVRTEDLPLRFIEACRADFSEPR